MSTTLLGVGPVSKNVIDATISISDEMNIPIILVASRRQIDKNGGYVGFTTKEFVEYVRKNNKSGKILIERDHGGQNQGQGEENLSYQQSVKTALESYREDIDSGFDILHIDPSLGNRPREKIINDIHMFYHFIDSYSSFLGKDIQIEVGTEECGGLTDLSEFEEFAKEMSKLKKVKYIVANTGTLVKEMRQVGYFDEDHAKKLVKICNKYGLKLKEHNLDYSCRSDMEAHPEIGIHSANIAPEYGTIESRYLMEYFYTHGMVDELWRFIDIAANSGKWKKWMVNESWDRQYLASICGHYVFNYPEVIKMKSKIDNVDFLLTESIKNIIISHLNSFGWYCE